MKTVVALFDDRRATATAVRELLVHGISRDRISLVSPTTITDARRSHLPFEDQEEATEAAREHPGAPGRANGPETIDVPSASPAESVGTSVGIGSVLLGVALLSLPAVGPVLAAGPLMAGLAAAGAGAGSADLPQRLSEFGIPVSDAERYTQAIRNGGVLVALTIGEEDAEDAAIILARHSPVEPDALREPPAGSFVHEQPRPEAGLRPG